jgi:hypothetical protein
MTDFEQLCSVLIGNAAAAHLVRLSGAERAINNKDDGKACIATARL